MVDTDDFDAGIDMVSTYRPPPPKISKRLWPAIVAVLLLLAAVPVTVLVAEVVLCSSAV